MIKSNFVSHEGPNVRASKTGIYFNNFILLFVKNCLLYDAIYDFSAWLRTFSNPADINPFRNHTKNIP